LEFDARIDQTTEAGHPEAVPGALDQVLTCVGLVLVLPLPERVVGLRNVPPSGLNEASAGGIDLVEERAYVISDPIGPEATEVFQVRNQRLSGGRGETHVGLV